MKGGARPALPFSSIANISSNRVRGRNGVLTVEYGEYPQDVAPKNLQKELEKLYKRRLFNSLIKTGKTYTVDSVKYDDYDTGFNLQSLTEYSYNGKKYVRVKANTCFDGANVTFSTGDQYKDGDNVWVEVKPIKWLVDLESDIAITEKILFAGIQFNKKRNYTGDFDKVNIKYYLDNFVETEIINDKAINQVNTNNQQVIESTNRKKNPYHFNFEQVSEEEIIKGAVQSRVAVFLHGRSSEGKSARIKQLDPDCEILYLRNITPDALNGKSVYNATTGEMIDVAPTWYKKITEKCKKEPDKIHIVFFDEITNALPSIQGMAYNIILDREVNGMWKLPDNVRIVAAGNDLKDSLAANNLAEPLFNRFAHVYIETTVESWLKWAATPTDEYERLDYQEEPSQQKIHPAIFAFIAYKGESALRSKYTGEKPNADPRKWEMASKMLYKTNQPEMLRALVGEEMTYDFVDFCNQQVITLEDVINDNYTQLDLEMNASQKYATALGLSCCPEENIEKVRDFVMKLGNESRALFDNLWSYGNERRMEKIAELKMSKVEEGGKSK